MPKMCPNVLVHVRTCNPIITKVRIITEARFKGEFDHNNNYRRSHSSNSSTINNLHRYNH